MPIPIDVDLPADLPLSGDIGGNNPPGPNPTIDTGRGTGRLLFDKFKFNETKFTSLRYTGDSFNGANSSEPLIQKPISTSRIGKIANPKIIAQENKERVSKLFKTTARGFNFIQKQKSLTFSNTRLESTSNVNSSRINSLAFYNEQNTLEQIGEDPYFGSHLDRFGLTSFMEDDLKYINIALYNNKINNNNNRLDKLHKKLGVGRNPINRLNDFKSGLRNTISGFASFANIVNSVANVFGGNDIINNISNKVNKINKIATPFLSPVIDQYAGGPNTKDGVGFTTIRRFDYTNDLDKIAANKDIVKHNLFFDRETKKTRNLLHSDPETGTLRITTLFKSSGGDISLSKGITPVNEIKNSVYNLTTDINGTDYSDIINKSKNLEKSYHTVLKPSSTVGTRYKYNISKEPSVSIRTGDKISWIRDLGINNGKLAAYEDTGINDRMPIVFTIIDPFTGVGTDRYEFSAFINGFKDSSNPEYSDIKYIGRSEYFSVYNGFKREVSFNFQIPCFSLLELRGKHKTLAALYSSTMGKYNNSKLGGILYKLKLGNYLNNEAGIITGISYDIPNDSAWDIDEQLAHNLNVSISFRVIHNSRPEYSNNSTLFNIGIPQAPEDVYTAPSLGIKSALVGLSGIPNIDITNPTTPPSLQSFVPNAPVGLSTIPNINITSPPLTQASSPSSTTALGGSNQSPSSPMGKGPVTRWVEDPRTHYKIKVDKNGRLEYPFADGTQYVNPPK